MEEIARAERDTATSQPEPRHTSLAAQRQDREQATALAEIATLERDSSPSQPPEPRHTVTSLAAQRQDRERATALAVIAAVERDTLAVAAAQAPAHEPRRAATGS